ncbi:MAG: hypothetical protein AAF587_14375 [Bacteroidota bacterium]
MRHLFVTIGLLFGICAYAQTGADVFILADISGSVNHAAARDAKSLISDIVLAQYNPTNYRNWRFSDAFEPNLERISKGQGGRPLISANKKAFMMHVGEKSSIYGSVNQQTIQSPSSDFPAFMNTNYPTGFNDKDTYLILARAEAAKRAKQENIKRYVLIEATDSDDDRGRGTYNTSEQDLIAEYSAKGRVKPEKVGILYYEGPGKPNYKITIWQVEHINFNPPGVVPNPVATTPQQNKTSLSLLGVGNQEKKPKEVEEGKRSFSWTCTNCENAKFRAIIRKKAGTKFEKFDTQNGLSTRKTRAKEFPPGLYEIRVMTSGLPKNASDTGYFEVKGGGGGFIWVLLLIALVAGGVYAYRKMNQSGPDPNRRRKARTERKSSSADQMLDDQGSSSGSSSGDFF